MENATKYIIATVGSIITMLFGAWDTTLYILILFIALDYATGVMKGYVTKNLSSDTGMKGIVRKGGILIMLLLAVGLDRLLNVDVWVFRTLVCWFFIGNEGISILENLGALGIPIPMKLLDTLQQLKDKGDIGEDGKL